MKRFILITLVIHITSIPLYLQDTEYLFRYGTRQQKIEAINAFMRQKTPRELTLLIYGLKDKREDIFIRQYILHALRAFPLQRAKYAVIWALECDILPLRKEAALAASGYPLRDVMYPIINALHDENHQVRKNALFSLAIIGDKSVLPFIKRSLHDEHPEVRNQAKVTIDRIALRHP